VTLRQRIAEFEEWFGLLSENLAPAEYDYARGEALGLTRDVTASIWRRCKRGRPDCMETWCQFKNALHQEAERRGMLKGEYCKLG